MYKDTVFIVRPVGVVRSPVNSSTDMPMQGVRAEVEVFEEYSEALEGVEKYSHLVLLSFLHKAERSILKAKPRRGRLVSEERGVFALRSPARPNPISMNVVELVSRRGNILVVEPLDILDGTPVIDLKPYVYGWDCVFSARSPERPDLLERYSREEVFERMLREARNFHGETCPGVAIGVRAIYKAAEYFGCDPKDRGLQIISGAKACVTDGAQAATASTNKRLKCTEKADNTLTFALGGRGLRVTLNMEKKFHTAEEVLAASDEELFADTSEFRV